MRVQLGHDLRVGERSVGHELATAGEIHAVRRGRYKLLRAFPDASLELYDLEVDPFETVNLLRQRPEVYRQLRTALDAHIARYADVPYRNPDGTGPGEIERPARKGK